MNVIPPCVIRLLRDGIAIASGERAIAEAASLLRTGEVVAIPTDTVYGLAAALDSGSALKTIFTIKGRDTAKTLPVLVPDSLVARCLLREGDGQDRGTARLLVLADQFWPGGLTVALPARSDLPPEVVAADGTVGIRVPDNVITQALLSRTGGVLAVTSANRSGADPLTDADAVVRELGPGGVGWVLDGGPAGVAVVSTVIGQVDGRLVIVRAGAIAERDLQRRWVAIPAGTDY